MNVEGVENLVRSHLDRELRATGRDIPESDYQTILGDAVKRITFELEVASRRLALTAKGEHAWPTR